MKVRILESVNDIQYMNIKTPDELIKLLKLTNSDANKRTGFWLFQESVDKCDAYLKINQAPWFIKYILFCSENKPIGMISFSDHHEYEYYKNNIHISDVQSLPGIHGMLGTYIGFIEKLAKKTNKDYLTLQCYEPSLVNVYKKFGFIKSDKESNLMYYNIK